MSSLKEMFSTPKRAALAVACLCVILVTAGVCIVMIANGARGPEQSTAIGGEAAQNFAFADAGVDPASAQAVKVKYERYQGTFVYEVEFLAGETEYEYKINAADGSVVKKEQKAVMGPGNSVPVAGTITLEEARDIALADAGVSAGDARFTKVRMDYEDGVPVYEVEFYTATHEYDYEIHAQNGSVFHKEVEAHQTSGNHHGGTGTQTGADIGAEAAKNAALNHAGCAAGDVVFTKVERDYDDGWLVYEIEFHKGGLEYEFEIDGTSGAVLKFERD